MSKDPLLEKETELLADIVDMVLYHMSYSYSKSETEEMIRILQSSPDSNSKDVKNAITVCKEYIAEC